MSDGVSPRALVRYTLTEPDSDDVREVVYDTIQSGTVPNRENVDTDVICFAEFPARTTISRYEDIGVFRNEVESKAEYTHWKFTVGEGVLRTELYHAARDT
ncbi:MULTISPECIES: hypothetical protein [unclassified Natrinema]|uniref:hypothetical protein n=1 Tax=unclassified Natrinema TaxID=2622230 RepID=UPI00026D47D7|nr:MULTISPECIES: hypothetical protein [unclassified Natrinema]AFO59126.1 hypothetical protein NJ7G_3909 [Natrinema sp. J7-2]